MRYQIYEAKSVKYDAQQRVGIITHISKRFIIVHKYLISKENKPERLRKCSHFFGLDFLTVLESY